MNLATKWFFDTIARTLPKGILRPCPMTHFKAYNLSLNTFSYMFQFLVGEYRTVTRFYDEKDDNVFTTHHYIEVKNKRGSKLWDWGGKNNTEFKTTT